ncbi:hypothetical protein ACFLS0_04820, partial [Candidatus Bipolaricaulota bacterium]
MVVQSRLLVSPRQLTVGCYYKMVFSPLTDLTTGALSFQFLIAVVGWRIVTWRQINEEVDALVHYKKDLNRPLLKSINYRGKRRNFIGTPVIEADEHSLYFDVRD